ncbi:MAG TPA: hypothetical protein PKY30_11785 [Myxococcota bacterium]|nr:hypothetical protein [Myxococcota bacterium]
MGWYLGMGTTQTLRLPDGRFRLYFASAFLDEVRIEGSPYGYPVLDAGGRQKFGLDAAGEILRDDFEILEWWKASGDDYQNLHFSKDFISFLDSVDGVDYPLYTPKVDLASGFQCENEDPFAGGTVVYEDNLPGTHFSGHGGAFSTRNAPLTVGFRAGWVSTAIRCSGAAVVYRDASVVYLKALDRYLMFVVECDGRGMAPDGGDLVEERGTQCTICVEHPCISGRFPKTRYVFFTCPDADFQKNVRGPFPVAPRAPDYTAGQWIGVPQAFMSRDHHFLFFYMNSFGYDYSGLHFAGVRELAADILVLEGYFDGGKDVDDKGRLFYDNFTSVDVLVSCETPSSPVAGAWPTLTDEHFVFCEDGYLHLYFSNRNPQTVDDLGNNLFNLDPTLVSHAVAEEPWDEWRIVTQKFTGPFEEHSGSDRGHIGQKAEKGLLAFKMVDCDPVNLPLLFGSAQIQLPNGLTDVVVNDPNIYLAATGEWILLVNCGAAGGLLRFKSEPDSACYRVLAC